MPFGGQNQVSGQKTQKKVREKEVQSQAPLVAPLGEWSPLGAMEGFKDIITPTTRSSNGSNSSDVSPSRQRASQYYDQFWKTKMCKFYLKQICMKGDSCKHAHSQEELRGSPDLRGTRLCNEFAETGVCSNAMCPYAHGQDQLRATGEFWKTQMCSYWQRNECNAGDACRHAHGEHELRQLPVMLRPSDASTFAPAPRSPSGSPMHSEGSPRSSRRGPRGSRGEHRGSNGRGSPRNGDKRRPSLNSWAPGSPKNGNASPMGSPMGPHRTANGQSMAPMAPMAAMAANALPGPMAPIAPIILVDEHGTPQTPLAPGLVAFGTPQMPMRLPMQAMSPPAMEINHQMSDPSMNGGGSMGGSLHGSPPNSPLARYGMPNVSAEALFAAMPNSYDD